MDILENIDELLVSRGTAPSLVDMSNQFIVLALVLAVAFLADILCRDISLKVVAHLIRKIKVTWDNIVFDHKVLIHLSRMMAPVMIYISIPMTFAEVSSSTLGFIQHVCPIYILITFLNFTNSFVEAIYSVYSEKERLCDRPLEEMLQTARVILWFVGAIIVMSILIDKSPLSLLADLGASAAVLILVLRDSVMGFVSDIQLSANDMLKVDDWTTASKYGVDGTVIEVTLNIVKVHNQDSAIATILPYLFVSDSFQNRWGMRESGGCHMKRSTNIDMNSVKFYTPGMPGRYRKIHLLKDYVEHTEAVIEECNKEHHVDNSALVNGRRQISLGVFRVYSTAYLRGLPDVNQELACMIHQLQPTDHGIPMELYFFCVIKDWVPYKGVQADVFDHVPAIIPELDLQVF